MPGSKRVRSNSVVEEQNVTSFIEASVDFKSNVSFHSFDDGKVMLRELAKPRVLLLGFAADFAEPSLYSPFITNDAKLSIQEVNSAGAGKCHLLLNDQQDFIIVAKIPDVASRHNCSTRPDVVYTMIRSALSMCGDQTLHVVYIGTKLPTSIAVAVSRASSRSFSAKKGAALHGYVASSPSVRVLLRSGNLSSIGHLSTCVQLCQRLVNAPTNLLDTVTFTEVAQLWVEKLQAQGKSVSISILRGEELREAGYGGLYGTGKAAEYPPHLVTLTYTPAGDMEPKEKIAMVGKGIVYDTGGLAIKSRDGMCSMKHDMGGAAAVFTGFLSLALMNAPLQLSCVMCLADNAVGPKSQRNDDILLLKSGLTIEINNTDAEGRLVLADGVYHASAELPFMPTTIVDMATLTGAQGIATGIHHAAIFSNAEEAESLFVDAGKRSGDLCFPVIYCPEFHNVEFQSEVADYKNSVKRRSNAQVSCAGQFIGNNLAKGYTGNWVHVDLASPATSDQATGFGVSLLVHAFASELL